MDAVKIDDILRLQDFGLELSLIHIFKAEMHLDSGAAPALVHYAQRRGSVFWCLLRHLEVDLALLDI